MIWTNVARTNVAWTIVNLIVWVCSRCSQEATFKVSSKSGQQHLRYSWYGQMSPGRMLPGQMSPWQLESDLVFWCLSIILFLMASHSVDRYMVGGFIIPEDYFDDNYAVAGAVNVFKTLVSFSNYNFQLTMICNIWCEACFHLVSGLILSWFWKWKLFCAKSGSPGIDSGS